MVKRIERASVSLRIAQALGLSDVQVNHRLAVADRVIDHAPKVWAAFGAGVVNEARVREISGALDRLERTESRQRLDATVLAYATTHTAAELRAWLRRFVHRVEADMAHERARSARQDRHVEFAHDEDGMAWLKALLPAHEAACIHTRLWNQARAIEADARTVAQREADLLTSALMAGTAAEGSKGPIIDIAVTMTAADLAGARDGFAESTDGTWAVPGSWILEGGASGETFWHRLLVDEFTGNTLSHQYVGYAPPAMLRRAIRFRSGVCATPGCMVPAERCELDHRIPHPVGPTVGSNLDPRCKRHHAIKGHRFMPEAMVEHVREHTVHRLPSWNPGPAEVEQHLMDAIARRRRHRHALMANDEVSLPRSAHGGS